MRFDYVFWKKLDQRSFGACSVPEEDRWEERVSLLYQEEKRQMEQLVNLKLGQMEERVLAWEPDEVAKFLAS